MKKKYQLKFFVPLLVIATLTTCALDRPEGSGNGGEQTNLLVADAGVNQTVMTDDFVVLDGTASFDENGKSLTYVWDLVTVPTGSLLTNSSIQPFHDGISYFQPDKSGAYDIQLTVNNGIATDTDIVTINAVAPYGSDSPPVADAGNVQVVAIGSAATVDGTCYAYLPRTIASYSWAFVSVPTGSLLTNADLATTNSVDTLTGYTNTQASFTPDIIGEYVLNLTATDDNSVSNSDEVSVFAVSSDGLTTINVQ